MAGDNGHVVYSLGISSSLYAAFVSVSISYTTHMHISIYHIYKYINKFATYITNTTTWHATHHFHEWKHKRRVHIHT